MARIGNISSPTKRGDYVTVYFEDGITGQYIAQTDLTSSKVAVLGNRAFSDDEASVELNFREVFKNTHSYEEGGVQTWAYLFNLYDHTDKSIDFVLPTWMNDYLDHYIRPMGDGGGLVQTKAQGWLTTSHFDLKGAPKRANQIRVVEVTFEEAMAGDPNTNMLGFDNDTSDFGRSDGYWGRFASPIANPLMLDGANEDTVTLLSPFPGYESGRDYIFLEKFNEEDDPTATPTVFFHVNSYWGDIYTSPNGQPLLYDANGIDCYLYHDVSAYGFLNAAQHQDFLDNDEDPNFAEQVGTRITCELEIDVGYAGTLDYSSNIYAYDLLDHQQDPANFPKGMSFHKNFTTGAEFVDEGEYMDHSAAFGKQELEDRLRLISQELFDSWNAEFIWDLPQPFVDESYQFDGGTVGGAGLKQRTIDVKNHLHYVDDGSGDLPSKDYVFYLILESPSASSSNFGHQMSVTIPKQYENLGQVVDDPVEAEEYGEALKKVLYRKEIYAVPLEKPRPSGKRSLYCQVGDNTPTLLMEIAKTECYDSFISPVEDGLEVVVKTGKRGFFNENSLTTFRHNEVPWEEQTVNVRKNATASDRPAPVDWRQTFQPFHDYYSRHWQYIDVYQIDTTGAITSQVTHTHPDPTTVNTSYFDSEITLSPDNWQGEAIRRFWESRTIHYEYTRSIQDALQLNAWDLATSYSSYYGEIFNAKQRTVRYKNDTQFSDRGIYFVSRNMLDVGTLHEGTFIFLHEDDLIHEDDVASAASFASRFLIDNKPSYASSIFKALIEGKVANSVYHTVTGTFQDTGVSFLRGTPTFDPAGTEDTEFPLLQIPDDRQDYHDGGIDAICYVDTEET